MVEPELPGPTRQRPGVGIRLAAAYYLIIGLIAAAFAAGFLQSLEPQDFLNPIVASVGSVIFLATARRLWRDPPRLGRLVGVGVVLGIAVAVLSIALILWAADFSGEFNIFGSKVPTVGLVLLFSGPLLWALASAVIVWRQGARQGERRALMTGLGGGALIVAVGTVAVGIMIAVITTPGIAGVGDMPLDGDGTMRASVGTATLRLEHPIEHVETVGAECFAGADDHLSVQLEAAQLPIEGRPQITVAVTAERDEELYVYITVDEPETGRFHEMGSPPGSIAEARRDGANGSFRFANLNGTFDLEGTIEWTCRSQ